MKTTNHFQKGFAHRPVDGNVLKLQRERLHRQAQKGNQHHVASIVQVEQTPPIVTVADAAQVPQSKSDQKPALSGLGQFLANLPGVRTVLAFINRFKVSNQQ